MSLSLRSLQIIALICLVAGGVSVKAASIPSDDDSLDATTPEAQTTDGSTSNEPTSDMTSSGTSSGTGSTGNSGSTGGSSTGSTSEMTTEGNSTTGTTGSTSATPPPSSKTTSTRRPGSTTPPAAAKFDGGSFAGGIALGAGVAVICFIAYYCYKKNQSIPYKAM